MSKTAKNAKTGNTSKTGTKSSKVTRKNLQVSAKQLKNTADTTRLLKYQYPADCVTQEDKKEFRRKARQTERRFQKQIAQTESSTERGSKTQVKELTTQYREFQSATYNPSL